MPSYALACDGCKMQVSGRSARVTRGCLLAQSVVRRQRDGSPTVAPRAGVDISTSFAPLNMMRSFWALTGSTVAAAIVTSPATPTIQKRFKQRGIDAHNMYV